MCRFIEDEAHSNVLVLEPRGSLKTTIIIAYILQQIVKRPNIRILLISAELGLAKDILAEVVGHIENNKKFIQHYGDLKGDRPKKWHVESIIVCTRTKHPKEATITCSGSGATKTGRHYDLVIIEDIHNEKNTENIDQIQKVIRFYGLTRSLLDPPTRNKALYKTLKKRKKKLIIVGTIWHYADLYCWLMAKEKERQALGMPTRFHILKRRAHTTATPEEVTDDSQLLWSDRLSREFLIDTRMDQGPYRYGCFYLNEPVDDDSAVFKRSWVRFHDPKKLPKFLNTYITVDPVRDSEDDDDKNTSDDHAAIVVVSFDDNWHGYIRAVYRGEWDEYDTLEEIIKANRIWKPKRIGIESVAWQKVYYRFWKAEMIRRNLRIPIIQLKTDMHIKKTMRIKSMVPYWKTGLFSIPGTSLETLEGNWAILMDELLNFPRVKTKDCIDALAYIDQISKRPVPSAIVRKWHPDSFNAIRENLRRKMHNRIGAENVR